LTTLARLSWNPYLFDPKLQQRLPRLRAPTLLVWGDEDAVLPVAHGAAFAALLPYGTLRTIPSCGHFVPFEKTAEFVNLALAFLAA
jgi:pimeloyl-ACP methyl ester carboxylesterase